jgi:non-specific serine/threonine protein kinase
LVQRVERVEIEHHEPRFGLLETICTYAVEQLAVGGEEAAVRREHAAWYLAFAERFRAGVWDLSNEAQWLHLAEAEHDNLRAALAWLERTENGNGMVQLAGAIGPLWSMHSHRTEGIGWLERALALGQQAPPAIRLRALAELGRLLERQGHAERARTRHEEQLTLARDLGDPLQMASALNMLGTVWLNQGHYDEAMPLIEEGIALAQQSGFTLGANWGCYLLGMIAFGQDDVASAATYVEAALARARELGYANLTAIALNAAGLLRCERGDEAGAATLLAESLPIWQRLGEKEGLAEWLAAVARLATCRGQLTTAACLYGAAEALGDALGSPLLTPPRSQYRRHVAVLRDNLGADAFAAAWAAGRALSSDEAVEEARRITAFSVPDPSPDADQPATTVTLTRRERDILRLVADGRTDREIAADLFISERTVEWHLTNAFRKLEVDTRAAAATTAVRRGLI